MLSKNNLLFDRIQKTLKIIGKLMRYLLFLFLLNFSLFAADTYSNNAFSINV